MSTIDKIIIIDFGSQTTQLIARRVRELDVYAEIIACEALENQTALAALQQDQYIKGIILSGGPDSVTIDNSLTLDLRKLPSVPILGICYGMQLIAKYYGGAVESAHRREFGHAFIEFTPEAKQLPWLHNTLANNISSLDVWMSHADRVLTLPPGFKIIASSKDTPIVMFADTERNIYGVQFHPEVTHTQQGVQFIKDFVCLVCGAQRSWTTRNIIEDQIAQIRATVGSDHVLVALSGGVDSSVLAALLRRAVGQQLHCILVDNGLLRLGEREQVLSVLQQQLGIDVHCVDAADIFLQRLAGISDPEQKRKIIGATFIDVFAQEVARLPKTVQWLAQGTIYPDVIESAHGSKHSKAIKSHHNVGGLPENMQFKLLEPLRYLFKDEVRSLGRQLGLPETLLERHPFPGPGLAVRIMGPVVVEYLPMLRQADQIFLEVLQEFSLYNKVSQAFAVFLPIKSVAVLGDTRAHGYVIALRAVSTNDFMTAQYSRLSHACLSLAAQRIINEVHGVARVVYDISDKPPATIEWE